MAGIFVSYRRDDTAGWAGRLAADLKSGLWGVDVFMDIDDIPPGVNWDEYIPQAVGRCAVMLALIGPRWLTITDAAGCRRLDDPADVARVEIVTALQRNIRVIPVLVGDAKLPQAEELPEDLKQLLRRQDYELADSRWEEDCKRLIRALKPVVRPWAKWLIGAGAAAGAAALGAAAFWLWPVGSSVDASAPAFSPGGTQAPIVIAGMPPVAAASPSIDVETMKLKRIIDANSQRDESLLHTREAAAQKVKPNLGVLLGPVSSQLAQALGLGSPVGAMISEVARGSSAERAGLRRGDVIVRFDGGMMENVDDFERRIGATEPGKTVQLDVWRVRINGVDTFFTQVTLPDMSKGIVSPRKGEAHVGVVDGDGEGEASFQTLKKYDDTAREAIKKINQ